MSTTPEFLLTTSLGAPEEAQPPLSPSSAFRWSACPISARLIRTLPETAAGNTAKAGTLLHTVFERLLNGGPSHDHSS